MLILYNTYIVINIRVFRNNNTNIKNENKKIYCYSRQKWRGLKF